MGNLWCFCNNGCQDPENSIREPQNEEYSASRTRTQEPQITEDVNSAPFNNANSNFVYAIPQSSGPRDTTSRIKVNNFPCQSQNVFTLRTTIQRQIIKPINHATTTNFDTIARVHYDRTPNLVHKSNVPIAEAQMETTSINVHKKNSTLPRPQYFAVMPTLEVPALSADQLLSPLSNKSPEFNCILRMITNRTIIVDSIDKVNNPYLDKAYQLKKEQKSLVYENIREVLMFHGTKARNVDKICRFNFDWRLAGKHSRTIFGKGVNFSPNAKYASNYSDEATNKVLIVAKVLIGRVCAGNADMELPPAGYDTTQKDAESDVVTVKYEDSEYCPAYVIYYHFQK